MGLGLKVRSYQLPDRDTLRLQQTGEILDEQELITSNCAGAKGALALHPSKLGYLRSLVMANKFPCDTDEDVIWKSLCKKIDNKHRTKKRAAEKTQGAAKRLKFSER